MIDSHMGATIFSAQVHESRVEALWINPDGEKGLSWACDGTVKLWRAGGMQEIARWMAPAAIRYLTARALHGRIQAFFADSGGRLGVVTEWSAGSS